MATFTIEITQRVPNYTHVTVEADTLEQAKEIALGVETDLWKLDWESADIPEVTDAWAGENAYDGPSLFTKK